MAARLLYVLGVATAFLVLTPVSTSAHCHKPTAYQTSQAAAETPAEASSGTCGNDSRRGTGGGVVTVVLVATAYGGFAVVRMRRSGMAERPPGSRWTGRGNPHDVPDLRETDLRTKDPSPNKVEGLRDVFTTVKDSIENGVLGGGSSARATATQWTAGTTSSTAKSVSHFQPTFAAPSPELLGAVAGYGAICGLAWLGPKVWSGIRSVWRWMR
jgi:hypothetical protein